MANQTGNDPAMFLYQPRRFKCVTELLPLQRRIGYNFDLFVWGKRMHDGRQGANGLLHALVRGRQIESGVERLQMPTEFLLQHLCRI